MQTRPFNPGQALQEALALHRHGRLRDAEKIYARVLKATPGNFDAMHLLGLVKAEARQFGEAYRLMSAALKANPAMPDVWANFANVLHALKRDPEALDAIEKALALRPGDPGLLQQRGHALLSLARPADALTAFGAALQARPNDPEAFNGRGLALAALQRPADALSDFERVLTVAPMRVDVLYNRANALLDLDRYSEALDAYDRVLVRTPEHVKALGNRGRALQALNRPAEAVPCFEKALVADKENADTRFNLALALLSKGDYARGFREYEWRWTRTGMPPQRKPNKPLWLGEFPLGKRTILLQAEQGLGDTIQFARYLPLLARNGAKIVLEVQAELKPLLVNLPGVVACHARGEALPAFDVHCPMGSLPLAMKTDATTIPSGIPYLLAEAARVETWRERLAALPGKRIAFAWAGHAHHANDRNRSISLTRLAPLLSVEGASFISIQRDLREGDAEAVARYPNVMHAGSDLNDMADTAALLSCVDLTIGVDTSVVHLAGALGREAYVMLPFAADWRWGVIGERSAWYPQLRLFRQDGPGDWDSVVARIRGALADFVRS